MEIQLTSSIIFKCKPQPSIKGSFSSQKPRACSDPCAVSISETFVNLRQQSRVALIPYITAGYPNLSATAEVLRLLDSCGSDIIEVGLPHTDPFLDGSVIKESCTHALARGASFESIISMLERVASHISCPITILTYSDYIFNHGIEKFMAALNTVGVRGILVPDIGLDATETLREEASNNKIEIVLLTTPITPTEQMKSIVEAAEGFVYLVSSTGVTGVRPSVNPRVQSLLQEIKEVTQKPVVVGFGISKPEHVRQIAEWGADGVVVGSAMVKLLGEVESPREGLRKLEAFTNSLKSALP